MKIEVKITKEVLEATKMCGVTGINKNCAISHACRGIFPNCAVELSSIYDSDYSHLTFNVHYWSPLCEWQIHLPDSAKAFIKTFDTSTPEERTKLQPFSFIIDVPKEVIDSINIDEALEVLKTSQTLKLIEL